RHPSRSHALDLLDDVEGCAPSLAHCRRSPRFFLFPLGMGMTGSSTRADSVKAERALRSLRLHVLRIAAMRRRICSSLGANCPFWRSRLHGMLTRTLATQ